MLNRFKSDTDFILGSDCLDSMQLNFITSYIFNNTYGPKDINKKTNHPYKLPLLLQFLFENSDDCPLEKTDSVDFTNSSAYLTQGGYITYSK